MTLGTAASSSIRNVSTSEIRGGASSARKIAAPTPNGIAISSARAEVTTVPKMNGSAPNFSRDRVPILLVENDQPNSLARNGGVLVQLEHHPNGDQDDAHRGRKNVITFATLSPPFSRSKKDSRPLV